MEKDSKPALPRLAAAFLVIGTLAFGGQGGLLAQLTRDLVERREWITEADIAEAFTYVQLLPGAVVVQVVAYLGWKLRRGAGATVATVAFLLPSVLMMLALAVAYRRVSTLPSVPAVLNGLVSAVVGLIALAAWKQARKSVKNRLGVVIAIVVFAGSVFFHLNPALLVVGAGLVGIVAEARDKTPADSDAGGTKQP